MKVRFWGTRGSLPAPVTAAMIRAKVRKVLETVIDNGPPRSKADVERYIDWALPFSVKGTYGTNTSCVELVPSDRHADEFILCDAGSGLRDFGNEYFATFGPSRNATFHIFLSHLHWDHIQGFPFFGPAYVPGNTVRLIGCHEEIEEAFVLQQSPCCFPVRFDQMAANIEFVTIKPEEPVEVAGCIVTAREQNHPGKSFGYSFERGGKRVVYSTDNEHKFEYLDPDYEFLEFFRDADLLIFDAQYTLAEATGSKEDWGHSNNLVAAEMAAETGVRHLCLFHQEPMATDDQLEKFLQETVHYAELVNGEEHPLKVSMAYDGMVIDLGES